MLCQAMYDEEVEPVGSAWLCFGGLIQERVFVTRFCGHLRVTNTTAFVHSYIEPMNDVHWGTLWNFYRGSLSGHLITRYPLV